MIYPLGQLNKKCSEIAGFFYNPNIHPFAEYKNRRQAVESYSRIAGIEIIYPPYEPAQFFSAVNMMEEKLERCPICWSLRLQRTAQAAKETGYSHFSTTLLVSPYQNQELLKKIGLDMAKEEGIDFYYEDFRLGFKKAHEEAKAGGIYCQNYCGCIYSEIERCRKSEKH
jgi:epoxyqueuosine reductase